MNDAPPYMDRILRRNHRKVVKDLQVAIRDLERSLRQAGSFAHHMRFVYCENNPGAHGDCLVLEKEAVELADDPCLSRLHRVRDMLDNLPEDVT